MKLFHVRSGKEIRASQVVSFLSQRRETVEDAWPGDIIGLLNHGSIDIGDTFTVGEKLNFVGIPYFAPELFQGVTLRDPLKGKQLQKGLQQLGEEGVVQVFWPRIGPREPVLGVVGELQLEVFKWRLENEYKTALRVDRKPWTRARWIKNVSDEVLEILTMVVKDEQDRFVALFNSEFEIDYAKSRYEKLELLEQPPTEEER